MNYKKDFPIFTNNPDLIFLDSAASSQKPRKVIDAISNFSSTSYANIHRGLYPLSLQATEKFENARNNISEFFGVKSKNCILTKNGTEASNIFSSGFSSLFLDRDDEIIIPVSEHHANILPWMQNSREKGAKIIFIYPDKNGIFSFSSFENSITEKTKIIVFAHVSNVTGQIFPVKKISQLAKEKNIYTVLDACQSAPHIPFHFTELGIDAAFITGHKLGAGGTGCLFLSDKFLEVLPPYLLGGDMVSDVTEEDFSLLPQPSYLESGTPAIENIIGFGSAIEYIKSIGGMEKIYEHEKKLLDYAFHQIEKKLPHWNIVGPKNSIDRSGNISLYHEKIHHSDVAVLLGEKNIAVRTGFHCANPLHHFLKIKGTVRISFWIYNDEKDIDAFVNALSEIEKMFS